MTPSNVSAKQPSIIDIDMLRHICNLVELRENMFLRFLPGGGKSNLLQFLSQKKNLGVFIDPEISKQIDFIHLDLGLAIDTGKFMLEDYFEILLGTRNLIAGLSLLVQQDRFIYFALDNFDTKHEALFRYLLALKDSHGSNLRFMITGNIQNFEHLSTEQKTYYSSVLHNPIDIPYLTDEQATEFTLEAAGELNLQNIDAQNAKEIVKICGGIPFLIKNFLRTSRSYPDFQETFNSIRFQEVVRVFIEKLSKNEQLVIKNLAYSNRVLHIDNTLENLEKFRLISNGIIRGQWYSLLRNAGDLRFTITNNRLTYDGVDFEDQFTANELSLLKALVFAEGEVVTRDDIAHLIWGENASSDFSSWAIDKNISRLRKHLQQLGLSTCEILTVKKKGYKLLID